jgi:uncharacterized membrane protein YphA (DoxX/SURF4 family)
MTTSGRRRRALVFFYHAFRIGLGLLFVWASWEKIADPAAFARVVGNYRILPAAWVNPTAVILPWVEAVCGVSLVTGVLVRGSLLLFNGLMAVFTAALVVNAFRGIDVDCGCFSTAVKAGKGNYLENIFRDLVLLGIGLWILWVRASIAPEPRLAQHDPGEA